MARFVPKVIETEAENEVALKLIEALMEKGEDNLTPEEDSLFGLVASLIESFESRTYAISEGTPEGALRFSDGLARVAADRPCGNPGLAWASVGYPVWPSPYQQRAGEEARQPVSGIAGGIYLMPGERFCVLRRFSNNCCCRQLESVLRGFTLES